MEKVCFYFSVVCGFILSLLGGFDPLLECLLIMMIVDIVAGVIAAAVFHISKYTDNGLSSSAMVRGSFRKIMMLLVISIAVVIDNVLGINYARNATVVYYICTEGLSMLENLANCGVPFPTFIHKILDQLKEESENGNKPDDENS